MANNHQNFFENKIKKQSREIILLARRKLNSIEKVISKALADSNISHDEFNLVIKEKQNCFR